MKQAESDGRTKLAWAKEAAVIFMTALKTHPNNFNNVRVSVDSFGAQGNANDPVLGNLTLGSAYNSTLNRSLTNDYSGVITAINNINYIQSGTCIQCGLHIANKQLTSTYRKAVILLSDGLANRSWTGTTALDDHQAAIDVANAGRQKGIEYWTIGYGLSGQINKSTLINIAGSENRFQDKPDASQWSQAFLKVLSNLCGSSYPTTPPAQTGSISITAIEDSYVKSDVPTANYQNATALNVDGSPIRLAYLKFNLGQLAGKNPHGRRVVRAASTSRRR